MRLAVAAGTIAFAAPFAAGAAGSKEGAQARLTEPLALRASPGSTIRVNWTVEIPAPNGSARPFGAGGMFVRLLGRTGTSRYGFAPNSSRVPAGRYTAKVRVPAVGIGGVRFGLRGTTDIYFPLRNDPFTSARGARCDVAALRARLSAFVTAYNRGDGARLDRLFSRRANGWYSTAGPGERLLPEAKNRASLVAYFIARHAMGDRLQMESFRFNGFDRAHNLGHFELAGQRRASDFRDGSWFDVTAKGALDCTKPPVTFYVFSLGGPGR